MSLFRTPGSPYFEARSLAMEGRIKLRWGDWLGRTPPALPATVNLADKVEGMLLGLAIGDALGNTSESMNPADRRARHGWIEHYLPHRRAHGLRKGLPSDDTQLAFRSLEHLVEYGRLEPQLLGNRLARGRIFGIGKATREWLAAFKGGAAWFESGVPSAGNGALMRIAPILLPYLRQPNCDLWADTLLAAHLTHDDELSNISCVALVDALWRAIGTSAPTPSRWWIDRWIETCDAIGAGASYGARNGHPPDFRGTISDLLGRHVRPALDQQLQVDEAGAIWHSGAYLLETVSTVLYILERFGHDPREAIIQAVNQSRDNDTVAAVVGAAVGALHGASALPSAWIDDLLGRTGEDDDHRIFALLERAGKVFGYGSSDLVRSRSAQFMPAQRAADPKDWPTHVAQSELWFKVVEFLQQNWAIVRRSADGPGVKIWFIDDGLNFFDVIECRDEASAFTALRSNGFERFDPLQHEWLSSPVPDADLSRLPWQPRRIYSSGEYWVDA